MMRRLGSQEQDEGSPIIVREVQSPGGGGDVLEIAFSTDGKHLVTGSKNLAVRIWGTRSGEIELLAPPLAGSNDDGGYHAGRLSCDVVSNGPSGGLLMAAGGATGGVLVWNCRGCDRQPVGELSKLEEAAHKSVSSSSSTSIGNTGNTGNRRGTHGPRPSADLRNNGHEYGVPVSHLAAYPDGSFFVSADTTTLKFWSAEDFACKRTIRSAFAVQILMVSSRGTFVFVAGESGGSCGGGPHGTGGKSRRRVPKTRAVIAVWNGRKRGKIYPGFCGERDPTRLLTGHGGAIRSLYTPQNPGILVTTALDAMVKVWDVPTGTCTHTVWSKGRLPSPLSYAALVNRGAWLLTSCEDGSLQVWGLDTGKCLMTLINTAAAATSRTTSSTSSQKVRLARLAVSRCGRLAAFAIGRHVKVVDFDRLADRCETVGMPGRPAGAYLRQALRFIVSPRT